MNLLYFASASHGGLADYAHHQIGALARQGLQLTVLCTPRLARTLGRALPVEATLAEVAEGPTGGGRLARASRFVRSTCQHYTALARSVRRGHHTHVLLAAYAEYFSPLWSGPLCRLARAGTIFGAVVHDPVRDAVVGPRWWHARSIASAYSFLRHAFVHEEVALDTIRPMPALRTTVIPHGPYRFETEIPARAEARQRLGLPADAPVLLAFGHIRDNKNLDLAITALADHPRVHLLVAGNQLSGAQRPADHYRRLAHEKGVHDRCHWHVRFIPESQTGVFFAAADLLCLTYSRGFRSASGVLNAATQFRTPCLASSGPSPLRTVVEKYAFGVWVEPDDAGAISAGLGRLLTSPPTPRWDDYAREHSWERNATIIRETFFGTGHE